MFGEDIPKLLLETEKSLVPEKFLVLESAITLAIGTRVILESDISLLLLARSQSS